MPIKIFALTIAILLFQTAGTRAEVIERVVASVDDAPVFLGEYLELKKQLSGTGRVNTDREILDILIDRKLMYFEAKRLRFDKSEDGKPADQGEIVERYLDMFVRAFVPQSVTGHGSEPADSDFRKRLKEKIIELRGRYEIRIDPEM
jgi:hypothetical protein